MKQFFSSAGLARTSARHPWFVIAIWAVLLVLAGVASTGLSDAFTTKSDFTNKPESVRADTLLNARLHMNDTAHSQERFHQQTGIGPGGHVAQRTAPHE